MTSLTCGSKPSRFPSRLALLFSLILIATAVLAVDSCSLFRRSSPKLMTFVIKSKDDTNEGQPFYIMIRYVNQQTFLTDSYQTISAMAFASEADPAVLAVRSILPGKKLKLRVQKLDKDPIGVYCLFTNPGERWKVLLSQPLKSKYKIRLDKNNIHSM